LYYFSQSKPCAIKISAELGMLVKFASINHPLHFVAIHEVVMLTFMLARARFSGCV
jgi:hypothetical protein